MKLKWSCSVVSDSLQPHSFQARILEWVAISFSKCCLNSFNCFALPTGFPVSSSSYRDLGDCMKSLIPPPTPLYWTPFSGSLLVENFFQLSFPLIKKKLTPLLRYNWHTIKLIYWKRTMCGFLEYSQTCALIITTYVSTIFITLKGNATCSGNHSPFLPLARHGQP